MAAKKNESSEKAVSVLWVTLAVYDRAREGPGAGAAGVVGRKRDSLLARIAMIFVQVGVTRWR